MTRIVRCHIDYFPQDNEIQSNRKFDNLYLCRKIKLWQMGKIFRPELNLSCKLVVITNANPIDMIKNPIVAPSLLAADFTNLTRAIELIEQSDADWLHMDIMDGRFVPNISFGMMIVEQVGKVLEKPMDVHLMIEEPDKYVPAFAKAGADTITVHFEACPHLHRNIQQIKDLGVKAGVAINPHTPVSVLEHIVEDLDLVLIMSVNPGFGGQKFIFESLYKIRQLRQLLMDRNSRALIEVDGGVGLQNAGKIMEAGADVLVAGSSVFGSKDPAATIHQLKSLGNIPSYEV